MTNQFLDFLIAKKLGKQPLTPHNLSFSLIPYLNAVQRSNDRDAKRNLFIAFYRRQVEPRWGAQADERGIQNPKGNHDAHG